MSWMHSVAHLLRLEANRSNRHAPEMQVAGESEPVYERASARKGHPEA